MPTLDWIGKAAVINHHREVPYHLLRCDPKLSVTPSPSKGEGRGEGNRIAASPEEEGGREGWTNTTDNLLVQGDNLLALKALLPYYAGRVKCIYIDPPYNTGDEHWVYNDAVNSTDIRRWLGKIVGAEAEDLSRHDKWLCMMYPRLTLLREFLRRDGVMFVSIDENEVGRLRLLMDEVFDPRNALGTLVWKRRSSSAMRGTPLSIDHEYVLAYAYEAAAATLYGLAKGIEDYPHEDERGRYASTDLTVGMGRDARPGQFYPITNPRTGRVYPANPERVWRFWPETMQKVIDADLIIWPDEAGGRMERPRFKTYYDPNTEKPKPVSSWIVTANANDREASDEEPEYDAAVLSSGMTQEGGKLLQRMLGSKVFAYPKPLSLVRSLVRAATRDSDIVLDSFAGTGTTGHAVLDLNNEDGGRRRFILAEVEAGICEMITAERLRRAVRGYEYERPKGGKAKVAGVGGGCRYCKLGEPLFDESGNIRESVRFPELAAHVFFAETGAPLPKVPRRRNGESGYPHPVPLPERERGKVHPQAPPALNGEGYSPLLGVHNGKAVYLLFNGVLGDKRPDGGNVLTGAVLNELPAHEGPRVVYGEGCRLGKARLRRESIVFRQIPYEIRVK